MILSSFWNFGWGFVFSDKIPIFVVRYIFLIGKARPDR